MIFSSAALCIFIRYGLLFLEINKENIKALYKAFDFVDDFEKHPVYSHLKKKLQMLNEYLEQGNSVTPTVIAADNFSMMEIN